MFSIAIGIGFIVLIIVLAIIAVQTHKIGWMIAAVALEVIAILFMAIFFHSWWFVVWAVVMSLAVFLFKQLEGLGWKIIIVLCALVIAVGGFLITRPLIQVGEGGSVIAANCTEAVVTESQTHGGKVEADLNDGDPFDYSLTVVNPNVPSGNKTLVVLTDPMYSFDVVHPVMYFTSYRLKGTFAQALCSASKLTGNKALAYVYVGKEAAPKGWTVPPVVGWWTELVTKQYSEKAITPGGTWTAAQIEVSKKVQIIKAETQLVYGQVWNPNKPGIVVHFQIEKGYEYPIPAGWQGTYWTVVNADPVLVQDRLVQASKEVVERDALSIKGKAVTLFFCGATAPTTELKIGSDSLKWTTSLEDLGKSTLETWDCQVIK